MARARAPTLATIYERHAQFVWLTLQRLGVHEADLDDLVQDVFVVAHRRWDSFTGASRVTTWLFGICTRLAANYRRLRRWTSEVSSGSGGDDIAADALTAEHLLIRREQWAVAERMLSSLTREKRAAFIMFELDSLSGSEIAELMGVHVGTVYSRLHAARRELLAMASSRRNKRPP
jgi:RNA polymerase sigma-70 factor (ECF subfamily)